MDGIKSREDYLETILVLVKKTGDSVRKTDIAESMGFSRPSVTIALKKLEEDGYIFNDDRRFVHLTPKGEMLAKKIYERHLVLTLILMELGVSKQTAADDACRLEHHMTDETFNKVKDFYFKNFHEKNS
ncbi:MAG: metal-dependent transcriptional regulator [Oscillospiraceae bacterium]|nr:metal-dependent transcriptional regulator [Oscillospiraceae bacterium]